jgi:hypothetical protein
VKEKEKKEKKDEEKEKRRDLLPKECLKNLL